MSSSRLPDAGGLPASQPDYVARFGPHAAHEGEPTDNLPGIVQRELDLWHKYLSVSGKSDATRNAYRIDLREFAAHADAAGVQRVDEIDRAHVIEWLYSYRERGCSEATIARKNGALRSFLAFCAERGLTDRRLHAPPLKKPVHKIPSVPSIEEIRAILATCGRRLFLDIRDRALLEFLYSTGCRRSEAVGLNLADVRLTKDGTGIHHGEALVRGKGRKQRIVFLTDSACNALVRWLDFRRPTEGEYHQTAVFLSREGCRIDPGDVSRIVRQRAHAAGVERRVTTHSLRHAFASHVLRRGANLFQVSEMLGHESIETTQIYLHAEPGELRAAHLSAHPMARDASPPAAVEQPPAQPASPPAWEPPKPRLFRAHDLKRKS